MREPTQGELICRLCQLRDELKKTAWGRYQLEKVIEKLEAAKAAASEEERE